MWRVNHRPAPGAEVTAAHRLAEVGSRTTRTVGT